jgi:hypothetical protein
MSRRRLLTPYSIMTLAAIVCAAAFALTFVFASLRCARRERAVAALRNAGAEVQVTWAAPMWLGRPMYWAGVPVFDQIDVVCFRHGEAVTDFDLEPLAYFPEIRNFQLGHRARYVTDAGLRHLRDLHNLEHLTLEGASITDSGLGEMAALTRLRYLNVFGTQLTGNGLRGLRCERSLEFLSIDVIKPDDDLTGIERFTALTTLTLGGQWVHDEVLKNVALLLNLNSLAVMQCERLTDNGLRYLMRLNNLRWLRVDRQHFSEIALNQLQNRFPELVIGWTCEIRPGADRKDGAATKGKKTQTKEGIGVRAHFVTVSSSGYAIHNY